jgi:transcriptional regulator with XRE-family HTH domain
MAANNWSKTAKNDGNPAKHFGRQMQKERLARGWSLREFAAQTGINYSTASLIENGKRPPTEKAAAACDEVFPDRRGWFTEYVRHEAPCCIPGSARRNSEVYSWA